MSEDAGTGIVALHVLRRERRRASIIARLRDTGATSADRAIHIDTQDRRVRGSLERLISEGSIRHMQGRYWLHEATYKRAEGRRVVFAVVAVIGVIASFLLLASLLSQ